MARTVTAQTIIDRAEKYADMVNSGFFTTAQKLALVDEAYTTLYSMLVDAGENYYYSTDTVTLASGTSSYPLPSDFFKLIGAEYQASGNQWISLHPFNNSERNIAFSDDTSIPSGTVRLRYVPAPATIDDVADTLDGVAGWEKLLVIEVALLMLASEESDTSFWERQRQRYYQEIEALKQNRDIGMPGTVSDVYAMDYSTIQNSLKYKIYGNSIHFVNVEYLGAGL